MKQKKQIILALSAILTIAAAIIIYNIVKPSPKQKPLPKDYIITQKFSNNNYFKNPDQAENEDVKKAFSKEVVTPYTMNFFKLLLRSFPYPDSPEAWARIRDFLYEHMSPEKADELLALFKKYLEYEEVMYKSTDKWQMPNDPAGYIAKLHELQDYRREYFGKETADILFGEDIKETEYSIRKNDVLLNNNLYGDQKKALLNQLNNDMWSDDNNPTNDLPQFDKYNEELKIYNRDLSEMNESQKAEKIKTIREEFFTPEVVSRLEKVDQQMSDERNREIVYRQQEAEITSNSSLSESEKNQKIMDLQTSTFGEDADAFRRREALKKATE